MQTITDCLWFDNNVEDAVNFYTSIFKNSKIVSILRCGDAGPGPKGSVLTITFELEGREFTALNGGPHYKFTPAISLVVNVETQEEVDEFWEKLSAGGEPVYCGWLTDKFGLSWQITPRVLLDRMQDKDPEKAARVMRAMMQMVKIDIEGVKRAYDGSSERHFKVQRTFDAPRDLVFKAWTEQDRLAKWWGPKGFTLQTSTLDPRPGGIFHYCMRSPEGMEMWGKFTYREVSAPKKLVFTNSFADAAGNPVQAPFSPNWPLEVYSTVTFTEDQGKTTVTFESYPINATELQQKTFEEGCESMEQGFAGTFDQLDAYLAGA
jgi:predicted 3-demethylubiquinone-9 3-methyltransferase (glyoxalase superfamily)/uncharacterized protein YndB with AHSA1/START domain